MIAITVDITVPAINGNTPYTGTLFNGLSTVPVRKSQIGITRKKCTVSVNKVKIIPIVVNTDTAAIHSNKKEISFSIFCDIFFVYVFFFFVLFFLLFFFFYLILLYLIILYLLGERLLSLINYLHFLRFNSL